MKTHSFKRWIAGLLSAALCLSAFLGLGITKAFAKGEQAEVSLVSFPREGDANYSTTTWGHDDIKLMNGWFFQKGKYLTVYSMGSYNGKICYCIEPSTMVKSGDRLSSTNETYWDNYPDKYNKTISGENVNLRFHSRDGRTDGVDYQCYTSVNRGSVAKRLNKGISIEHSCESPYIQGWKLEMMAEQVFDRYIENADKVIDLSYAMLEKHIADQEELPDNTDVIQRKQGEIEKLMNKRTNLIEMRAEGDIDKEMFRSKKQEIENRVAKLTEEIKGLQPEKEPTSNEDYSAKLLELRERLKEYTGFDYSVIPESIVEAFVERIWVSKDEFRWYLRTESKEEGEFDPDDHIKIGSFTQTIDDAKKYIYSFSTRRRVYKWVDLNVSVWI